MVVCTSTSECVCVLRQGTDPFTLHTLSSQAVSAALPTVPKDCADPLLIQQPVMDRVIWPAPEGSSDPGNAVLREKNKTKIQAKNSRKGWRNSCMWPRVRGIWASALGNQRGPGHGPKHWHSITRCSTVSAVLGTDWFQATSSPSHNAWTLSAISRDCSQCTVWMGHLVRVGDEKSVKSTDTPVATACGQWVVPWPILFTNVEAILNTTIHSAQRTSQDGNSLLLDLPQPP